jgi:alpha-glucosidase
MKYRPRPARFIAALTNVSTLAILFVNTLFFTTAAFAQSSFDFTLDNKTHVQIAAVGDGAFRLSVCTTAAPVRPGSVFLADPQESTPAPGYVVKEGNLVGIKTGAGELLVDPASGQWSLRDSAGKDLVPPARVGGNTTDGAVEINVGWPVDKPIQVYGTGNAVESLLAGQGHTRLGNGRAVVPHYWSDLGYVALAVTGDDNAPASWNPSETGITWRFPGNTADLYLIPAPTLRESCRRYARLSGLPPVPPRWSFGYLQSRWGWKDRAYIDDTLQQFTDRKLPVDGFIFDFEWYTTEPDYELPPEGKPDYTDFSFNPKLFPHAAAQIAQLKSRGIHVVGIRKPRLGNAALLRDVRSRGWIDIQKQASEKKWLLPRGGHIDLRNIDFQRDDVRAFYAQQLQPLLKAGIDGWWDDEGELTYTTYYWWNAAEAAALAQFNPAARLWTINRAFAPGLQRFGAAAWTGDIHADFKTLRRTPTDLLNWSLAGMDYGACDIGGFSGEDSPELLTRWMQAGVFFPVMRAHSDIMVRPRFPWLYGPDAEAAIRHALQLRYRLIPTIYSLAHEAHDLGLPLMRPLAMEFPDDPSVADVSSEWMLGDHLLAAPVLTPENSRTVYLPADDWYEFDSNKQIDGPATLNVNADLNTIPAYVRAGTILPLAGHILHTADLPGGPLELQIYPGKDARFTLVEDDGQSTDYLTGLVRRTRFAWNDAAGKLSWKITGNYAGKDIFTTMNITVFYPAGAKTSAASLAADGETTIH